jgi:hypothetical protein
MRATHFRFLGNVQILTRRLLPASTSFPACIAGEEPISVYVWPRRGSFLDTFEDGYSGRHMGEIGLRLVQLLFIGDDGVADFFPLAP